MGVIQMDTAKPKSGILSGVQFAYTLEWHGVWGFKLRFIGKGNLFKNKVRYLKLVVWLF